MNNDRFKFRVWKPDWKQYDNDNYLSQDGVLVYAEVDGDGYSGLFCDGNDGVIERCTGLKDINGKLIYEGDVVSWPMSHPHVGIVEWNDKKFKFCLKTYTYYMPEGLLGCPGEEDLCDFEEFLIMGNIHEPKFGIESEVKG